MIILIGRPAAGKSEVIDYLRNLPDPERLARLHIAPFKEIDDFVWVWQLFEDDDIREKLGRERLNTTRDYYFRDPFLWNFLIGKINLEFDKEQARNPEFLNDRTILVEFSRGGQTGFAQAFSYLSDAILKQAVIVYVRVSYEESLRRNRRRARGGQEDSILYHSLPDEKMETYYRTNDWDDLSAGETSGYCKIRDWSVPFAVFQNEPELTDDPGKLGPALDQVFDRLWHLRKGQLTRVFRP